MKTRSLLPVALLYTSVASARLAPVHKRALGFDHSDVTALGSSIVSAADSAASDLATPLASATSSLSDLDIPVESIVVDIWSYAQDKSHKDIPSQIARCGDTITNATLSLPTFGAVEIEPADKLEAIALGLGYVDWICQDNRWAQNGSNATLYDISCNYNSTSISALSTAFNGLAAAAVDMFQVSEFGASTSQITGLSGRMRRLGTLTSPENGTYLFDFRQSAGGPLRNDSAYAQGPVHASQSAPVGSYDIDWLRINVEQGALAKEVFRVQTAKGYPPTYGLTCTNGETYAASYSAQFWFYKETKQSTLKSTFKSTSCSSTVTTTAAQNQVVTLVNSVAYGLTSDSCTSISDCSSKCAASNECVGYSLSSKDGVGMLKTRILSNKLGYSPYFTSGIKRKITNKQYVDRTGTINACPSGQVTSADFLGCIVPVNDC